MGNLMIGLEVKKHFSKRARPSKAFWFSCAIATRPDLNSTVAPSPLEPLFTIVVFFLLSNPDLQTLITLGLEGSHEDLHNSETMYNLASTLGWQYL